MTSDGTRLEAEGYFHFSVKDVRPEQKPYSDDALDGFSVILEVVEGEHAGKTIGVSMRTGLETHKDKGEFCRKVQTAFGLATNQLTPDHLGKKVSYEETSCRNHQVVAKIKLGKPTDSGKQYYDLDGRHIYHVDDPNVKDVPKNAAELAKLDKVPGLRKPAEYFEPLYKKSQSASTGAVGSSSGANGSSQTAPAFDSSGL